MDPNATLNDMIKAAYDRDYAEYQYLAAELYRWLSRGGFAPTVTGYPRGDE